MKRKFTNRQLAEKSKEQIRILESLRRDIDRYMAHLQVHVERMGRDESAEARSLYKQTVRAVKSHLYLTSVTFDK